MALFDLRRIDSIFQPQKPAPHAPEVHTPTPVAHAPTTDHPPIPRAIPVTEPSAAPAHVPATAKTPAPASVQVPKPAPVQAPAPAPVQAPATSGPGATDTAPGQTEAEKHAQVTHQVEALKEHKTILKPGQKGAEVIVLQQQLKQLGLHVEQTGVMDKATEGYIMALQTGGGLGADGVVGPKTLDQLLKLDQAPVKPVPGNDKDSGKDDNVDHMPDDPKLAAVYLYNRQRIKNATDTLNPDQQRDMEQFIKMWPGTPKNGVIITSSEAVGVLTHSGL